MEPILIYEVGMNDIYEAGFRPFFSTTSKETAEKVAKLTKQMQNYIAENFSMSGDVSDETLTKLNDIDDRFSKALNLSDRFFISSHWCFEQETVEIHQRMISTEVLDISADLLPEIKDFAEPEIEHVSDRHSVLNLELKWQNLIQSISQRF